MMVRQVLLKAGDTNLTCWLEDRVKRGNVVTLKSEPGVSWTVVDTYAAQELSSIKRGWNNNI